MKIIGGKILQKRFVKGNLLPIAHLFQLYDQIFLHKFLLRHRESELPLQVQIVDLKKFQTNVTNADVSPHN